MKMKIAFLALSLMSASAFAGDLTGAGSQSGSIAGSQSSNNGSNINFDGTVIPKDTTVHQTVDGTQTLKNTPSVSGPSLTTSNDTCMGSASGSANGPGFGLSFGKTYKDENCIMLKNSRELWNMGMKAAAMARLCMDPDNKAALEMTDFKCPQTVAAEKKAATNNQVAQSEPTDPIVRRRMGLPALAQ